MKQLATSIAGVLLGLFIGLAGSRMAMHATKAATVAPTVRSRADRGADKRHAGLEPLSSNRHTLDALLRLNLARVYRSDVIRQLQGASDEQLEKLLLDLMVRDTPGRQLLVLNLRNRVVREIYQRKGPASLEWAEKIGHPEVFSQFISRHADEDVLAAIKWIDRFKAISGKQLKARTAVDPDSPSSLEPPQEFDRLVFIQLVWALYQAAMSQGTDVALEFRKRMGDDFDEDNWNHTLPPGFDCRKYLEALDPASAVSLSASQMIGYWAAHDKDSALAFARSLADTTPERINFVYEKLFESVCMMEGETAAADWLSGALSSCSDDERNRIFSRLYQVQQPSPAAFRDVMEGLRDDSDRAALAAAIIEPHRPDDEMRTYLGMLNQSAVRASAIEASARRWAAATTDMGQAVYRRGFYESLMSGMDIPLEVRGRVIALWQDREKSLQQ